MAETLLVWRPLFIALMGGILPSLLWLWFWLRADKNCPEPKGLIAISFFAGMAVVYFALPLQKLVMSSLPTVMTAVNMVALKFSLLTPSERTIEITLWAFIEEFAKYATVFFIAFKSKHFDEPIDAVMYLITAALGFAAMENTFYILKDLAETGGAAALLNGNLRFIGATIAHVTSSAFVGIAIAFSFKCPRFVKALAVIIGLSLATLLHAYFNLSIMEAYGTKETLLAFMPFWGVIIIVIALLQIIKRLQKTCQVN